MLNDPLPPTGPGTEPVWKRCLDFDRQGAAHYNDWVLEPLFQLIEGKPKRVLELGTRAARSARLSCSAFLAPRWWASRPVARPQKGPARASTG
jgi:hypothetical protein